MNNSQKYYAYIGTYASKAEQGIYIYTLDSATGELTPIGGVSGIENPSFLTISADGGYLYAVGETETFQGQQGGSSAAFAIDAGSGHLTLLNQQPTTGADPCYLSIDRAGSSLLVANYSGGSIALFPVRDNGEIGNLAQRIQHLGKGVRPDRQEAPHPHEILPDASGAYVFVPDLGLDKIFTYRLDTASHTLTLYRETALPAGSGPRHLAFHPSEKYAYLITELASTIVAFSYDVTQASFSPLQTVSTLPDDFTGESTAAEIQIAPSGKFLYASNRGHDSIVVYSIEQGTGRLTYVEHVPMQGKTPRYFTLAPGGRFLFAANQDSASIITYAVDESTGRLTPTGQPLSVPRPVCITWRSA